MISQPARHDPDRDEEGRIFKVAQATGRRSLAGPICVLLSAFVLPMGSDFRAGFCQVDVLVDVIDPRDGDKMMVSAIG